MERPDLELYRKVAREIRWRMDLAEQALKVPRLSSLEFAALQLRTSLELIVYSSLVANKSAVESIKAAFATADVNAARKAVRRANPQYWPVAVTCPPATDGALRKFEPRLGGLPENEWGRAHGFLSELLHASNPFGKPDEGYPQQAAKCQKLRAQMCILLNSHQIWLVGSKALVHCDMLILETGDVQVVLFEEAKDGAG